MLNLNPAFATAGVDLEISNRDKVMLSTIYGEVVKNLEISKTALIQETPTVQLVDQPELPLEKEQNGMVDGNWVGDDDCSSWGGSVFAFIKSN